MRFMCALNVCDAKFAVCDVTLKFCRKVCDAIFACKSMIVGYERKLIGLRAITKTVVMLSPACDIATDQQVAPRIKQDNRSRYAQSVSLPVHRVASVCYCVIYIVECIYTIVIAIVTRQSLLFYLAQ